MKNADSDVPPGGIVVIWHIDLDDARWDRWAWVMTDAEWSKALRFRTPVPQARWRRGRSALRCMLSMHTGQLPSALVLLTERFGKLALPGMPVHFNVSHTERWAMIAVASTPVGIDVECLGRTDISVADTAAFTCHPAEMASIRALPEEAGIAALLRLWTQKEAYVKAIGTGLQHGLTAVRMTQAGVTGAMMVVDDSVRMMDRHFVHVIDAPAGCVASLCIATPEVVALPRDASFFLDGVQQKKQ